MTASTHARALELAAIAPSHALPSPSLRGNLNFDIYERIIDLCLADLLFGKGIAVETTSDYTPSATQQLRSLCLVSTAFYELAHKRLYNSVVYNSFTLRRTLQSSCHHSCLVKHLTLDARTLEILPQDDSSAEDDTWQDYFPIDRNAADIFTSFPVLPNLNSLLVYENDYAGLNYINSPFNVFQASISNPFGRYTFQYPAINLTCLQYYNGTTLHLARLLSHLPQLKSLHLGRMKYQPPNRSGMSELLSTGHSKAIQPACRLEQLSLQSVHHLDGSHVDWLFSSSSESLQALRLDSCTNVLESLLPVAKKSVNHLEMSVRENKYGIGELDDESHLETMLDKLLNLKTVTLHVRNGWTSSWPDAKHEAVAEQVSRVKFEFVVGDMSV